MFTQLENLKKLNARTIGLLKRRITLADQIILAVQDDAAAREKLLDMNLPPEQFTQYTNEARSAQRRRANLQDKRIDLEEQVKDLAEQMYSIADNLLDVVRNDEFPDEVPTVDAAAPSDEDEDESIEDEASEIAA